MIKNYILLPITFLLLIFASSMKAQVAEQDRPMTLGVQPAFVVLTALEKEKDVEKIWKDFTKDMGLKIKKNRKAGEFYEEDADIQSIGQGNSIDFYSRIEETAQGAEMIVWIDMGSTFLTSSDYSKESKELIDILNEFEKRSRVEKQNMILEDEEKVLKQFDKDLSKLKSDKDRYEKAIEDAKAAIKENEKNIETNLVDQEKKVEEIGAQKTKLEEIRKKIAEIKAE